MNQGILNSIKKSILDYLETHQQMTVSSIANEEWFKREDPLDFATAISVMVLDGILDVKFKWEDSPELYDDLSTMVREEKDGRKGALDIVWMKRNA